MSSLENIVESSWKFLKKKSLELGLCMSLLAGSFGCRDRDRDHPLPPPPSVLEISGPISNPPVVLAGYNTTVDVSAYIPSSTVELLDSNGVKIADMNDDGLNGDQAAGDNVYTTQLIVNESSLDQLNYIIRATRNVEQKVRDVFIPVVHIPTIANNTEFNQIAKDTYLRAIDTKSRVTALDKDIGNTSNDTLKQVGDDFVFLYKNIKAITNKDISSKPVKNKTTNNYKIGFVFDLFELGKDALSLSQEIQRFSENPDSVETIKQGLIDAGIPEKDLQQIDQTTLAIYARDYEYGRLGNNPDGRGRQILRKSARITVKESISPALSLTGDGLSQLFGLNELGNLVLNELVGKGVGTFVDHYIDSKGEQGILIGKVNGTEQFTTPTGIHNIIYSFGEDIAGANVEDIKVINGESTPVYVLPGTTKSTLDQILFYDGFTDGIHSMNSDGTNIIRLTTSFDDYPAWSPDKKKIAFVRWNSITNLDEIYMMNADSTNQVKLITNSQFNYGLSSWSPDGKKIAFFRYDTPLGSNDGFEGIYVANTDGTTIARLTNQKNDRNPAWSPDGTKIAFEGYDFNTSNYEIYVMNADGTNLTNLTNSNTFHDRKPAWSPDGKKIAFYSSSKGSSNPIDIKIMESNGSNPTIAFTGYSALSPAWSPDGKQIIFLHAPDAFSSASIYRMNADGTNLVKLVDTAGMTWLSDQAWR